MATIIAPRYNMVKTRENHLVNLDQAIVIKRGTATITHDDGEKQMTVPSIIFLFNGGTFSQAIWIYPFHADQERDQDYYQLTQLRTNQK